MLLRHSHDATNRSLGLAIWTNWNVSTLHLFGVELNLPDLELLFSTSITELSIGPTFTDLNCGVSSLQQLFERLLVFRIRLPSTAQDVGSLNQFLDLLNTTTLTHLEVVILGTLAVPWTHKISVFQALDILRISKHAPCEAAEIEDLEKWLASGSSVRCLHIHYSPEELSKVGAKFASDWLTVLPNLTHLYFGGLVRSEIFRNAALAPGKLPHVVIEESMWAAYDLFVAPVALNALYMHPFLLDTTLAHVEYWIREFKYASHDLKAMAALFIGWAESFISASQLAILAHPLFIPILAEAIRKHAANPDLWAIVTPLCSFLFEHLSISSLSSHKWVDLAKTSPNDAPNDTTPPNAHYHGPRPTMSAYPQAGDLRNESSPLPWTAVAHLSPEERSPYCLGRSGTEIKSSAFLQLIFENLTPAIEHAIEQFGCSAEAVSIADGMTYIAPSIPIPSSLLGEVDGTVILKGTHPISGEDVGERRLKRANCDLLRFLAIVCRHAPSTVYPSSLCFSNSDTILRFIMLPWHAGFGSLNDFTQRFVQRTYAGFAQLIENPTFCHRLYHFGLADRIYDMLERWEPSTLLRERTDTWSAPEIPVFIPLLAQVTPEITMDLLNNHSNLVHMMLDFLPYDVSAEWTHPIWSHLTSHGALTCYDHPSKPTPYCRSLITNILSSARIHNGGIGNFLAVYLASFCEHCRHLFIEGVGDDLKNPHDNVKTGLDLMVMRSRRFPDFSISVFSWLVEPASRVKEWLQALKDKLECDGFFALEGRVLPRSIDDFFTDLASAALSNAEAAAESCPPWSEIISHDVRTPWDSLSTVSQSPALISIVFPRIVPYLMKLFFTLGQPNSALSVFYHTSCFKGEDLMAELERTEVATTRDEHGGMKILTDVTLPYRLLPQASSTSPISTSQGQRAAPLYATSSEPTHREDGLTASAEVLLALFGTKGMKDNVFILGRLLANMGYYHAGIRAKMQQSHRVSYLIGYALTAVASIGEQTALLVFAFELYGSFSPQWIRRNLATPVWKAMEDVLRIIPILTASNQPWWQAVQIFLVRSLLRRSMPLILNIGSPSKSSSKSSLSSSEQVADAVSALSSLEIEHEDSSSPQGEIALNPAQIETVWMLVDAAFMLSLSQDITTTETAYEAIFDALRVPEEHDLSGYYISALNTSVARAVSKITVQRIKEKYEERLKTTAEIERFGHISQAEKAYELFKCLSR